MSELSVGAWTIVAMSIVGAYMLGWFVGSRNKPQSAATQPHEQTSHVPERDEHLATPLESLSTRALPQTFDRTTLGRYRIERELGRGAMGAVYLGHDPQIGRSVAIKTMALTREFEGTQLAEARTRFFREAEVAGRLKHPDIVTIFDASEAQDLAFIAMEYLPGCDLLRYTLPGQLLPVPVVLRTIARVAQALAYAHMQGVVHRDIKPANVMIDLSTNVVKVTDFGIARITDACRTRTGMVLGTPSFMSPEQLAGRDVDGRSDLYALGVMLFQLLTGTLPHHSESMAQLMSQITNEKAPDVRTLRPELPEALSDVVALALEKRPELRYANGKQMADDLLEITKVVDL
jgi:eukaryotic-like serine/threonine-protein kinase